jgi:RNA polymerase sigma-70 factor (ECF subfamily)
VSSISRVASPLGVRHDAAVAQARASGPRPAAHRPYPHAAAVMPDAIPHEHDAVLARLYADHAAPLLAFVLRLTGGDRQRAEDVVQETLLRAWRHADRLNDAEGRSARPWLVTVARRIVIDEHRGSRARPAEALGHDLDLVAEEDHADRVLQVVMLRQLLRTLRPAHREILVETYIEGRTVAEAAQRLGLPLGTAKSRIYYALSALRAALADQEVAR